MEPTKDKIKKLERIRRVFMLLLVLWVAFTATWSVTIAITLLIWLSDLQAKQNTLQTDYNKTVHDWADGVNTTMTQMADWIESLPKEEED